MKVYIIVCITYYCILNSAVKSKKSVSKKSVTTAIQASSYAFLAFHGILTLSTSLK